MVSIAPSQSDRFKRDLARLLPDPAARLGVAVSGGPDSMALLHLAAQALPGQVEAATVDHRLRIAAAAEADLVARTCAAIGVPHRILPVAVERKASVQAAARQARYVALAAWGKEHGLAAIATAHHADDQAETLLMRFGRGAGLAGLAGIRERRDIGGILLLRPLLGWRRAELAALIAGVETVDDPSNIDPRYDRTHARSLLSAAGERLDPARLAVAAACLAEAEEALQWVVAEAIRSRTGRLDDGRTFADMEGLPREVRRRMLLRLIGDADSSVDGPALEIAMKRLDAGQVATLGGLKLSPGRHILIEKAPPHR